MQAEVLSDERADVWIILQEPFAVGKRERHTWVRRHALQIIIRDIRDIAN